MYLCFYWSNNCGDFFRRKLVRFILTIFKRNIWPAKLQENKNAHSQIDLSEMVIHLKRTKNQIFYDISFEKVNIKENTIN